MSNFSGYLLGFVEGNGSVTPFPHKYILASTYKCTPNQREEIKAYRDENTRNLTRITASGKKSKIEFGVRDKLHEDDLEAILNWFTTRETSTNERKIKLRYWNVESLQYKDGFFYRPDVSYPIEEIRSDDIIYGAFDIHLIEY